MGDVGEPLGLEEAGDLDRPGPAHARQVVAPEIDEHHVLGAILVRGEQPLGVTLAGLRRAGDRVQRGTRPLALHQGLGRRADQGDSVELEQEQVGRGVDAAQRPVEGERRDGGRPLGALGEDDLEGVPGAG